MPAGFERVLLLKYASIVASTLVVASAIAFAQSDYRTAVVFAELTANLREFNHLEPRVMLHQPEGITASHRGMLPRISS